MREILFRGKRVDNGEWVEGSLIITTSVKEKMYIVDSCYCYDGCVDEEGYADFDRLNAFEVDSETVGQFTGLTDKNGKKIFEGDIVSFKRVNALGLTTSRVGDVRYYDELPIFYIMATTGDAWDWVDCEDIEVIGNIHDNRLEDFEDEK